MRRSLKSTCLPILLVIAAWAISPAVYAQAPTSEILGNTVLQAQSSKGTVLEIDSELHPLEINKIHSWLLKISDSSGSPIVAANIEFIGGMPEHDHGLPTLPQVTDEVAPGVYLLEGMRFHMQGLWRLEIELQWQAAGQSQNDSLTLDFDL